MSIASYNSDKVKLQDSIRKLYTTLNYNTDDTTQYEAIKDETKRLSEREEVIFRMVGTLTVIAIIVTVQRIS
jgi:FixJ family two-component response regulator